MSKNVRISEKLLPSKSEIRRSKIPTLVSEGLSKSEIAKRFNVSYKTIQRDCYQLGNIFKEDFDPLVLLGQFVAKYNMKERIAFDLVKKSKCASERARALKVLDDIDNNFYDFLFRIGILKEIPKEVIVEKKTTDVRRVFMELREVLLKQSPSSEQR